MIFLYYILRELKLNPSLFNKINSGEALSFFLFTYITTTSPYAFLFYEYQNCPFTMEGDEKPSQL